MEKKLNVFPKNGTTEEDLPPIKIDAEYEEKREEEFESIYEQAAVGQGAEIAEAMRERTRQQIIANKARLAKLAEEKAEAEQRNQEQEEKKQYIAPQKVISPIQQYKPAESKIIDTNRSSMIAELSQPQLNSSYDLLPLPSDGKLYPSKKANVKVAYMNTSDENILTSQGLLESGEFLEILINRKLLETSIRYKDLHTGDRNALIIWLRATSYGEMYPVTLLDENDVPFETEINLNDLKVKKLGVEPDMNGHFDYELKQSGKQIKFKLLTVGDVDEIESLVKKDTENGVLVNNQSKYTLQRQIVSVNGDTSKQVISELADDMRIMDASNFRKYIEEIESGVDLRIEVPTPGGSRVTRFLPLNIRFFWPDFGV